MGRRPTDLLAGGATALKSRPPRARDPERTRARILAAALAELSAKGFSGARVDAIARRAGVNKRMIYHYFGSKEGLRAAVFARTVADGQARISAAPDDPADLLLDWFEGGAERRDWIRMLQWEALEAPADAAPDGGPERRRNFERATAKVAAARARGLLPASMEPAPALLALVALAVFPWAFPQIARLTLGAAPERPAFRARWRRFLRTLAGRLRDRP